MAHKVISKAEAVKRGLNRYFTGKPCPNGHIDEIFVNGRCRTCTLESTRRNREKARTGKTGKTAKSKAVGTTAGAAVVLVTPTNGEPLTGEDRKVAPRGSRVN